MPNPMERSIARSEQAAAANRQLTGYRQGGTSLTAHLHGMHNGQEIGLEVPNAGQFQVRYDARQSHGDDGRPVPGATVGEYTITHPNGMVTEHPHGPHATNERAAKMGANRNARGYAAEEAVRAISRSASGGGVFNDRRR